MTKSLTLISIGDSVGMILPDEILSRLNVSVGDNLYVTQTHDGIELRRFDPEYEEDMAIAERVMSEDRDVLRRLAE